MGRRALVVLASAALLLAAPPAPAGGGVKELVAQAEAKAKSRQPAEAASLFGQAIALAQRDGDLLDEQTAAEAFVSFHGQGDDGGRRLIAAATLSKLEPKRCGAFVSAPLLAGEMLLAEVAAGDGKFAAEAAAALSWHARGGRSGAAIGALASLSAAVKEIRAGDAPKAAASLKVVLERAVEEQWTDLALAAGAELAVLRLKGGDAAGAAAAVASAAALVSPRTERRHLNYFKDLVEVRLKGAPEAVLKPWENAMGYLSKDAPGIDAPAGAGADGGSVGKDTPFGLAVKPGSKTRILATVLRAKEGFDIRIGWDPKFHSVIAHPVGVRHVTEGGMTLAFADRSVGIRAGDPVTGTGAPGADSAPACGRAFYRLAAGETWTLTREGVVQITGK